jgi:hypothetical protein
LRAQTKRDPTVPAKGVTQQEFCDRVNKNVEEKLRSVPRELAKRRGCKPLYLFDHAAFHECPLTLQRIAGIQPEQRVPHPAWGPDFNQPIEHAHGRFKSAMQRLMDERWWPRSMRACWKKCQQVWEEVNSAQVVSKDVARLPKLYDYVKHTSMGNWALKELS